MAQIDEVTLELKHVETDFIVKEKLLIEDLTKYEVSFILHLRIIVDGYMQGRRVYFMLL